MAKAKHSRSPGLVYVPDRGPPYAGDMTKPFLRRRALELADEAGRQTNATSHSDLVSLALTYLGLSWLGGSFQR